MWQSMTWFSNDFSGTKLIIKVSPFAAGGPHCLFVHHYESWLLSHTFVPFMNCSKWNPSCPAGNDWWSWSRWRWRSQWAGVPAHHEEDEPLLRSVSAFLPWAQGTQFSACRCVKPGFWKCKLFSPLTSRYNFSKNSKSIFNFWKCSLKLRFFVRWPGDCFNSPGQNKSMLEWRKESLSFCPPAILPCIA